MNYYFPIQIDERRLHFLKLQETDNDTVEPVFGFIVTATTDNSFKKLVSVETDSPQLISTNGKKCNESLSGHQFKISKIENNGTPDKADANTYKKVEVDTYKVEIIKKQKDEEKNDAPLLSSEGFMGAVDCEKYACIKLALDKKLFKEFVLVFSYTKGGKTYKDAIRIFLCPEKNTICAALDFGSEASQIRFGRDGCNYNILKKGFLSFCNDSNAMNAETEYWQGSGNDDFYKSIFFITTNLKELTPNKPVLYANRPEIRKENGDYGDYDAFVRQLVSANTQSYDNLVLLPNLKLLEIGGTQLESFLNRSIELPDNSDVKAGDTGELTGAVESGDILRCVLNNFLHCILSAKNPNKEERYLRMILLVPNVYLQSKVNKLVENLYEDYKTIKKDYNELYEYIKGFEVQVVSESDASFMGFKSKYEDEKLPEGKYYLVIDAGKGTTDFSIIHSIESTSELESDYRNGIPASSNVITYAFYEALRDYFMKKGIDIHEWVKKAETSKILNFTKYLDELKKNYSEENDEFEDPNNNVTDIISLNTYLKNNIERKIPGCKSFIDNKIDVLVKCLIKSIGEFMTETTIKFHRVLLSGRGFLFEPFKEEVIKMLIDKKWIEKAEIKDNAFLLSLENGDKELKTLCLAGAFALQEEQCSVNRNSGLIGYPIIQPQSDISIKVDKWISKLDEWISKLDEWISKKLKRNKKEGEKEENKILSLLKSLFKKHRIKPLDINFYYRGSENAIGKIDLKLGSRTYHVDKDATTVFFVGEGFLPQGEKEKEYKVIEEKVYATNDRQINRLMEETLFPHRRKKPENDKASQSSSNNTTAKKEPKKTTSEPDSAEREDNNREATGKTHIDENA